MTRIAEVQESEASAEVSEMYEDIKREMGIPFVPNIDKALAQSPNRPTLSGARGR